MIAILKSIDGSDVRMIERGEKSGFSLESGQPQGIPGKGLRQDLDRDFTFQPGIPCLIYLTHPASAERANNFVGTESSACPKSHKPRGVVYPPDG